MEKVLEGQKNFWRNQSTRVAFLSIPSLIFAVFLGFGLKSIFITSSALIISTVLFISSKNKPHLEQASEYSEDEWIFQDNVDHSPEWSDESISDEESLIEIELPSGNYVDQNKEESKFINLQQRKCHALMELLAEINEVMEEDNLIEIDIAIGSIKCSRFEITA